MASFNRNSWHYRLADGYTSFNDRDFNNICPYIRAVCCGFGVACLVSALIGGALGVEISWLIYIVGSLVTGTLVETNDLERVVTTVNAVILLFALYGWRQVVLDKRIQRTRELGLPVYPPKEDGFFKIAYNKFHDKTCINVEFEGDSTSVIDPTTDRPKWQPFFWTALFTLSVVATCIKLFV